jgi:hypothetical protein
MTTRLANVTARTAAEVCRHFELGPAARALLTESASPAEFLDLLAGDGHWPDAVRLLSHGLGRREAVWWACQCARDAAGAGASPEALAALRAAETWVYQPSEANRRAAEAAAQAEGLEHPASFAAMAGFWSGGSIAPPANPQPVPPPPLLTAQAVANAVMLAAVASPVAAAAERYRRYVAQGIEIANSGQAGQGGAR